jgi:predicted GIY-YIG superfamily endonuclease
MGKNKTIGERYYCRVCGIEVGESAWGKDGKTPSFDFCYCCRVEFGNQDYSLKSTLEFRQIWIDNGMIWDTPKYKPADWDPQEQFKNIPAEYGYIPHYVYIIRSLVDRSHYTGCSENPAASLLQHNNKESPYTSTKIPWKLIYIESCKTNTIALDRESVLKKYSDAQIVNLICSTENIAAEFS